MKFLAAFLTLYLSGIGAAAPTSHEVQVKLQVSASPLQSFRALSETWQIRHWRGALEGNFTAERGTTWRFAFPDGTLEEGICLSALPGELLAYTSIHNEISDTVTIHFRWNPEGTEIDVSQVSWDDDGGMQDRGRAIESAWAARIERLKPYLNETPGCYFAFPVVTEPAPAVILLHDRLGINRTIRSFADTLAQSGYIVVAVDMFKGEVTADLNEAEQYIGAVSDSESVEAVLRVAGHLRNRSDVQKNRIAVWGLGYGGSIAYSVVAASPRFRGCASWYSSTLPSPELQKRVSCPVLAIFGDQDIIHPRTEIEQFDQALVNAGVRIETVIVPGGHSFADPAFGEEYNELTTVDALARTFIFLDKRLKL